MVYGYARCSTDEAKQDISRQVDELKQLGATDNTIFLEYSSGTKRDRVALNKLLSILSNGDEVVCTEVSRITRSTKQLYEIIEIIKNKKLKLVIKDSITIDCSGGEIDPMTKAFLQISGVFSELERDMISQRVKSGMANAKLNGKKLGRPKTDLDNIPQIFYKYYPQYANKSINLSEFAKLCGMSRTTIYKYIRTTTS